MNTYFISDMHFGHTNIIKLCDRPFLTAEEMDNTLIENWNSVVQKDDIVFVLGDVSFYPKDKTKKIITALKGTKYLVKGNHDEKSDDWYRDCGFMKVYDLPVLFHDFYLLSHKPLEWLDEEGVMGNIHGHIHNDHRYFHVTPRSFNVSVEQIHYTPILFENIVKAMKEKENG